MAYTVRSSRSHRAHTDQVWFGSASRLGRRGNILSPAFVILASPLVTLQGTTPHPRDTRVLCTPSPLARSERATRPSSLVQCVRLCVTTPLQSERASLSITHARGGLALEDPAYDSSTTTAHLPDEIAQAVTSAIILLSNDEYHCRYDKSRLFLPDRQQTKSQPRDSSLSSPVSAKRPEGRDSKAYRHTVSSISLACYTQHYTPQWTECVRESAE